MAQAADHSFWDLYSHAYDAINFSIPYSRHLDELIDAMALEPGNRVLDLGCGTGNLERRLVAAHPSGVQVEGIDHSPAMLARARRKCTSCRTVHFDRMDLEKRLPYRDGTFDRVVVNNVLYALSDREGVLREVARVLRPGGRLVLSDPKPDASINRLVAAHFDAVSRMPLRARVWNYVKTFVTLPLTGLAPILLSALAIGTRISRGAYHFSSAEEVQGMLVEFTSVRLTSAYADQSWLVVARKG